MAIIRNLLKVLGFLGVVIVLGGAYRSYILMGTSIVAIFLGATDFGGQCPLIFSSRHLIYWMKSKRQHPLG